MASPRGNGAGTPGSQAAGILGASHARVVRTIRKMRREASPVDSVPGLSTGKVLLGALATSIPANAGAYALLLKGGYSPRASFAAPLLILGGAIAGVAGPAIGARLAGGGFMPGVLGSVVGIGLGGLTAGGAIGDDRGVHEAVLFSVFSLVHAGITTLFVVKAEQYAAAGR